MPENWTDFFRSDLLQSEELRLLAGALIAILILAIISRALTRLMERLTSPGTFLHELVLRIENPIHLLFPLMALQVVLGGAPDNLMLMSSLRHLVSVLTIATFTWLGLKAVGAVEHFILISNPADISDNLQARRIQTQTKVLTRTLSVLVVLLGVAGILMTFPSVRQFGTSLLASAGLAGLVVGFAARPVLGNLIAGLQIAITQPIRLDDVVIIENEWGRIEEITGTYVVVRIWDSRRLVVPLQWIIENPFQNWTRTTSELLGSVFLWVDYSVPVAAIRQESKRLCEEVPDLWQGNVCVVQVTDCNEQAMQIRVLADSENSSNGWDLRCYLRESLLNFINREYPGALPKIRARLEPGEESGDAGTGTSSSTPDKRPTDAAAEHQPPV
jgi:small-conductance mechanosensitive channel